MLLFVFPVFLVSILVCADEFDRGDEVIIRWHCVSLNYRLVFPIQVEVYVNRVSPLGDRDIIFHRYQLPVCRPDKVVLYTGLVSFCAVSPCVRRCSIEARVLLKSLKVMGWLSQCTESGFSRSSGMRHCADSSWERGMLLSSVMQLRNPTTLNSSLTD